MTSLVPHDCGYIYSPPAKLPTYSAPRGLRPPRWVPRDRTLQVLRFIIMCTVEISAFERSHTVTHGTLHASQVLQSESLDLEFQGALDPPGPRTSSTSGLTSKHQVDHIWSTLGEHSAQLGCSDFNCRCGAYTAWRTKVATSCNCMRRMRGIGIYHMK